MKLVTGIGGYFFFSLIRSRRKIFFYLLLGLLFAAGIGAISSAPAINAYWLWLPHELVEEVGKALVVAAILAGSVDIYLKRRLAEDFARDVSPFIEGFGLPKEFQDEIAFIKRIPLYRRNYRATYRLSRDSNVPSGMLRVHTTVTYDVYNSTDSTELFDLAIAVENAHPHIAAARVLSAGLRGDSMGPISRSVDEISRNCKELEGFVVFSEAFSIPPGKEPVSAWIEGEAILEENDSDLLLLTYATANLTIHVEAPNDLEVRVYFGHRCQEDSPPKVAVIPAAPGIAHTWQISAAMLIGHSIHVEWKKKKTPPQVASPAGSDN